ncbi:MAG TPA: hypothetical protein VF756_25575 [Thermoanaerobaculia bacterium]
MDLAAEGSRQEALLGCDFVLRMDPQFTPARQLQDRLKNGGAGAVAVDDLRRLVNPSAGAPATPEPAPDDLFNLGGLSLDLPDLPGLAPLSGAGAGDLGPELRALLEQRRFEDLLAAAERERGAVMADPELMALVQEAQGRMEAAPYVEKFLSSARAALEAGNPQEVARLADKARSLDPTHPGLAEIETELDAATAAPFQPSAEELPGMGEMDAVEGLDGFDLGFDTPSLEFPAGLGTGPEPSELPMPPLDASLFGSDAGGTAEGDDRIRQLLDEGQRTFDSGDPQGAIDVWSRIFLIDIDHQEAARRIEMARKLRAESERQVEEVFHEGVGKLEAGDTEGAKRSFQRVLELQPGHHTAREYLQQLEAGQMPVLPPKGAPAAPATGEHLSTLGEIEGAVDELKEEILVPPDPGEMPAKAVERRPAKAGRAKERSPGRLFLMVGAVVLVLAAAGGWYFLQNRDQLFPNSQPEDTGEAAGEATLDPIERAVAAHKAGRTASAISQLRRIPPSDPHYQEAQALISQWAAATETPAGRAPQAAPAPGAPAQPAVSAERLALLAEARAAHAEGSNLKAIALFEKAAAGARLEPADAGLLTDARIKAEPLARQVGLFKQQEWQYILNDLWRMREASPGNRDVKQLIVDSYYNLGVQDLQRADTPKAAEKFQEALTLAPDDEDLRRNFLFAQTYQERQKDLLYRIYVKYLAYR